MKRPSAENTTPGSANALRAAALRLGALDIARLAPQAVVADNIRPRFASWLDRAGNRGALPYLDSSLAARLDPFAARPWAKAALVAVFRAGWGDSQAVLPDLPAPPPGGPAGLVSAYALGPDYHTVGRGILSGLAAYLEQTSCRGMHSEACVDTAPLPEVFMAAAAGLGQPGRHGLLRHPEHGCRLFIAVLFVDAELPAGLAVTNPPPQPDCADCGTCIRACPTGALRPEGIMDVRRCRGYLSMEYRGVLNARQRELLGDCLFGCDACTACCPPVADSASRAVCLEWLLQAPAAEVRRRLAGTALEHAGVTLLRRNAVAILRRRPDPAAAKLVAWAAANSGSPVVRDTALDNSLCPS